MKDHNGFKYDASYIFRSVSQLEIRNLLIQGKINEAIARLEEHRFKEDVQAVIDTALEYYIGWLEGKNKET